MYRNYNKFDFKSVTNLSDLNKNYLYFATVSTYVVLTRIRTLYRSMHTALLDVTKRGRGQLKCDGTRAETRFRLSAKRTSPFKSAGGHQFSRLLAVEVCASAVVMLDTPCSEVV